MVRVDGTSTLLWVVVLSIVGIVGGAFATRLGAGISLDSTVYIDTANNLLSGRGLSVQASVNEFVPLTHYPPLFPVLLAAVGKLGMSSLDGARWLNVLLFGGNILLVGLVVRRFAGTSSWAPVLGSYFILTSTGMLLIHSMVWTEPSFILTCLLGLFLLGIYIENRRTPVLVVSSVMVAMGFLIRYVGATLVATGVIGLLLPGRKNLKRRVIDAVVFSLLGSLPLLLWWGGNLLVAGSFADREVVFHPIGLRHARGAVSTLAKWLLPDATPNVLVGIVSLTFVLSLLVSLSVLALRGRAQISFVALLKKHRDVIPRLFFTFVIVYVAFLVVSISFFDAATSLNPRILAPVYVSVLILALYVGFRLLPDLSLGSKARVIYSIIGVVFVVSYLGRAVEWIIDASGSGLGYARQFDESMTIERLGDLPVDIVIYSNAPEAIKVLTGRFAYMVPLVHKPYSLVPNTDYQAELDVMRECLGSQRGVVVWLDGVRRWYLPSEEELRRVLPLELISSQPDGAIYRLLRCGSE